MGAHYLACDLGGTNINMGLLQSSTASKLQLVDALKHKTESYASIDQALYHMLAQLKDKHGLTNTPPLCVCASGPTDGEFCKPSNLPEGFVVKRSELEKTLNTRVTLINDFSAVAYSIAAIDIETQTRHFAGSPKLVQENLTQAHYLIVGAGTGLGTAQAHEHRTKNAHRFFVQPGEGGWADMAPSSKGISCALHAFLSQGGTRAVCWEDVISSSKGIPALYAFLCHTNRGGEFTKARERIEAHSARTGDIRQSISALSIEGNTAAQAVLNLWVSLYGRCCSNYALLALPHALFLAGGATQKNIEKFTEHVEPPLKKTRFLQAFQDGYNEHFEKLLENIPVYAFTDYNISLYGAAWYIAQEQ